jgi:uncharacterized protein DUF5648
MHPPGKSMTTSMTAAVAAITLALGLWTIALAADAATIWTGPPITFSKAGGADPSQSASQDRITPAVWITRRDTMGLYNAATEAGYSNGSPAGTEWAYGTTANLANLIFKPWVEWNGKQPPSMVGRDAVVHLIAEDIYIDIKFTAWGTSGAGNFSYQRSTASASPPPPASNPVVEFYNTILDHYFITADANEATAIDNGNSGPGWSRTGDTFKVGGDTFVCRFYGSLSPGPNSHFYTADADECAFLKQLQAGTPATDRRWNFESNDFSTTPAVNRDCPAGLVPVYRAYNNGFARNIDSNHRITSNAAAIQAVVTRGWIDEGVVMCAPQ